MGATESIQALTESDAAPPFELPGADGETYSLADFDGYDALLIVFTCNHCKYARAKIDTLNELAEEYDEVAVVGINSNDEEQYPEDSFDAMVEWVESGTVAYDAYLRDESQDTARAYGAECTPDPFLFANEDGTFRLAYHGRIDDALNPENKPSQHDMREAIGAVLASQSVDKGFLPSRGCSIKWID
jgi:peroxiredoxin